MDTIQLLLFLFILYHKLSSQKLALPFIQGVSYLITNLRGEMKITLQFYSIKSYLINQLLTNS